MSRYMISAIGVFEFYLFLNPMTGRTEGLQQFGPFKSKQAVIDFYNQEKVELYQDEGPDNFNGGFKTYNKTFRKGGPLEWMNPLRESEFDQLGRYRHGIQELLINIENIVKQGEAF